MASATALWSLTVTTRDLTSALDDALAAIGLTAWSEATPGRVVLHGAVASDRERQAAYDVARRLAPHQEVLDDLVVDEELPLEGAAPEGSEIIELDGEESLEAGDFTDQHTFTDPLMASGGDADTMEDLVSDGDRVYSPPSDPVLTTDESGAARVLGGLSDSSMDSVEVERSALDGLRGDEALADAVRRELREDSATTGLDVRVAVDAGVAYLRGKVASLDDAESAEEVAARVPGILEVREELEVEGL
jgi:osmotically-inducible protein OsmY